MLRALIFDFDGTILDTETPEYEAWRAIYDEHGARLPLAMWALAVGTHGAFDPVTYLEEQTGARVDRGAIEADHKGRTLKLLEHAGPREGVEDLLREAQGAGLALGLASSSRRAYIEDYLRRLGLERTFAAVCTRDDVAVVKPDPALYLLALERLGVRAHEAVAIEDSPNGAQAAQAAGLACLVTPNPITSEFAFPDYGLRLGTLLEADLALCERLVSGTRN